MRTAITAGILLLVASQSCKEKVKVEPVEPLMTSEQGFEEVVLTTADSLNIYAYWHEIEDNENTLVLFHQGGSNARGEYTPIIPKLLNMGFNILTVDQRSGGQRYGSYNKTVADIHMNRFHYCDAYPDLVRALQYADAKTSGKIIVWGSSYSAMLVLQLAQEHSDKIAGVLSFSPASGPPMNDCQPEPYLESLQIPILILKPASEMESDRSKNQQAIAAKAGHPFYIAKNGVHGSSMLVEERTGHPVIDTWNVVTSFLENVIQQKAFKLEE